MNRTQDETPTIDSPPPREVLGTRTEHLRCPLSNEEHRAKGVELARQLGEYQQLKDLHKDARAEMLEQEKAQARVVEHLQTDVAEQAETRPVECEEIADYRRGIVEITRIDNGKVVWTREIRGTDRQRTLS